MASRNEFLLLALASAEDGALTPLQIQKAMFLLNQEASKFVGPDFYRFVPYNYGPFNSTIYDDLNALVRQGDVAVQRTPERSWPTYTVTGAGLRRAQNVAATIDPEMKAYVDSVVGWIKSQSFSSLLRAIYAQYPEFAVNSVFSR